MYLDSSYPINTISRGNDQKTSGTKTSLKSILIDIFNRCINVPGKREIIVSGYVLADGKGDYFHMISLAKTLCKLFPDRRISLIAASDFRHLGKLPELDPKVCTSHVVFQGEAAMLFPTQPPIDPELFKPIDVLKKVKESALMIAGPIQLFQTFDSIKEEIQPKKISFREYGDNEIKKNDFSRNTLTTGFDSDALGIFTKKKKDYSFNQLQNQNLKHILFNTIDPTFLDIQDYLSTHETFLCYVSRNCALTTFIDHCLAFTSNLNSFKEMDVIYPSKASIQTLAKLINEFEQEKKNSWKDRGFSSIKIIYLENDQKKTDEIYLSENGRCIRIIDVGFLVKRDFNILVACSNALMGCTGDTALAAALCYDKLPFYEAGNKSSLLQDLIDLSNNILSPFSSYAKYLSSLLNDPFETILKIHTAKMYIDLYKKNVEEYDNDSDLRYLLFDGKRLPELELALTDLMADKALPILKEKSVKLIFQAEKIGAFVRRELSIKPKLRGKVNEFLCRDQFPDFALYQDKLIKAYLENTVTDQEFIERIEEELSRLNLLKNE